MDRIAPDVAERRAARLFLTPRRSRRPRQPALGSRSRAFALQVDGFRLAVWSWGEGPTVLLLHGWSGCAADMESIASALGDSGFRVVIVDLPAHGLSDGRETSMVDWLRALHAVDDVLGPFHAVIGHSFGGAAATLALSEELRAGAAVLLAPPSDPSIFIDRLRSFIGLRPERSQGMARHVVRRVGRDFAQVDAHHAASSQRVPALILHDPEDTEVPWDHGRAIASAWPDSRFVSFEGMGHYQIVNDARAIEMIVDFVKQHAASTPRPETLTSRSAIRVGVRAR